MPVYAIIIIVFIIIVYFICKLFVYNLLLFSVLSFLTIAYFAYIYIRNIHNKLIKMRHDVDEAESNVKVSLKKQYALMNKAHDFAMEYLQMEQYTQLKTVMDTNSSQAMNILTEKFPNLKSNEQFHHLQVANEKCSNEVAAARNLYNEKVKQYNVEKSQIPRKWVADFLHFETKKLLDFEFHGETDVSTMHTVSSENSNRLDRLLK